MAYPARYGPTWREIFDPEVQPWLQPGITVLDVGAGKRPTIPPDMRPAGCRYVGLDVAAGELEAAAPGSYDETVVGDVTRPIDGFTERFDLIVSFMVFEHVAPMNQAIEQLGRYLKPGGGLVMIFAGRNSVFARLSQVLPHRVVVHLLKALLGRRPENVFPAHYDRCTALAMGRLLAGWKSAEIRPFFRGASYFRFSPITLKLYLAYENWAAKGNRAQLATHYLVHATR